MRLIIFVKFENYQGVIPFDIIDNRPIKYVIKEIINLASIQIADFPKELGISLKLNDSELNISKTLTENGVQNGDLLDAVYCELIPEKETTKDNQVDLLNENDSEYRELTESDSHDQRRGSTKPLAIPGRKIDFD